MAAPPAPFVAADPARQAIAAACDVGHPHHHLHAGRRDTTIRDPHHDDPTAYESREDWQRALWRSRLDPTSKRYIKQLENLVVDGWEKTFDALWTTLEEALDRGLPITDDVFAEYIRLSVANQLANLDKDAWTSGWNGLWVGARQHSYLLTGFDKQRPRRRAQTIDTLEEQAQLARLRQTSLQKVKTITDQQMKRDILDALARPGAAAKNPTAIANDIIRQERKKLEEVIVDRKVLREEVKSLYDNMLWMVQRITRTETANAYWLSTLTGYREQGFTKVKFNSHTAEQRTCPTCLSLDGTEHSIDTLLSDGGRYPLSTLTHPNCRCWPTPIVSHVTLESMEQMYRDEPERFAPGQTVFDRSRLEMEDVVQDYQTYYGVEVHDVPVEHEGEVKETLDVIRETPYQQYQPTELRFVKDVGETDEFRAAADLPDPVLGQVTSWTTPDNRLLVSQFSSDDGNTISAAVLRGWAARVYDEDADVRRIMDELHARDEVGPQSLAPETIETLLQTFTPFTCMRRQLVDNIPTVALEKRLREATDERLEKVLTDVGISARDRKTIMTWRRDRPVWTLDGRYVPPEGTTGSERNRFINRTAELGPRDMFIESATAYVNDPWTLLERDAELYGILRTRVFGEKEFKGR